MNRPTVSVVIPLYNKQDEVTRAVLSAAAQSYQSLEIIVVDDGSTDLSAERVEKLNLEQVRLISQPNAGVSAARNRGTQVARGEYVAFLDADDWWEEGFLSEIVSMIEEFPDCGLYSTGFNIVSRDSVHAADTPKVRGVVDNFFRESLTRYVSMPSSSAVPREVLIESGGFPVGMKLGEDQYLWAVIARSRKVCFSPMRLMNYSRVAANRSSSIYVAEQTQHSLHELYDPMGDPYMNEYIARVELGKALVISAKGGTKEAREAERFCRFTRFNRRSWRKLYVLNRLPVRLRPAALAIYNRLAWLIARKGL